MSFGTWFTNAQRHLAAWFSKEEALVVEFFTPLMQQVKAEAIKLGKGDMQVGFEILKHAATNAVIAAATSPGDKVAAAEAAFLTTAASEGITAIHNAEAGAIKAAVAIVQQQAAKIPNPVAAVVATHAAQSVGDEILKKLGG